MEAMEANKEDGLESLTRLSMERRQEDLNRINELERRIKELERKVIRLEDRCSSK